MADLAREPATERSRYRAVMPRIRLPGRRRGPPAPRTAQQRVKTPTVLQMEAVECGAAALSIVLSYYRKVIPLEELRVACGVSRDGSKANNVLRAAREYGLEAKGWRREPVQLRDLAVPMIVHWNFNHFLVLEGFVEGKAYLNDPASGPRVVPEDEFDQSFTGVALVFAPSPTFQPGGQAPSLMGALRNRLAGFSAALWYAVLAGLALVIPGLVSPTFSKVFVDDVLVKGMQPWLKPLLLAMTCSAVISAGLTWLQQRHLLRFETKLAIDTSSRFFWHVLRLPVDFFNQRYAGEIANRVGINDKVARLLSGDLATTALNLLVISFYGLLMIQYDVWLTVIGVMMASLNFLALKYVSRRRVDLNQRLAQDRGKAMGVAMGGLQTIETLKAAGAESDFFSRWSGYQAKVVNADQQLQLQTQLLSAVPPLLMAINSALMIGVGGTRVMNGLLSMGALIAFQALMSSFIGPINRMVDLGGTLQTVRGDMNRLDDVQRTRVDATLAQIEEDDDIGPQTPLSSHDGGPKLTGMLELRDITFGYNKLEPPLIEHFSLKLTPGSRVALVGGSGCGKSTLAKLVCGLYDPWEGQVLFDGRTRLEIPRDVLTRSFACVDQEIFIFEGTLRDNITLWDSSLPESEIVRAARDAAIHADVATRTGGYGTVTEEGGRNFSGGQRQRLEIARALVGNPSLLVLDEATSALDPSTEKEIDDSLRRRGCTCLIVAHRLSTIRDCDEIIVLERGKVVQRGTHEELSEQPGHYRDLIAAE